MRVAKRDGMPIDLRFDPNEIPLLTDLYELTMAASYFTLGFNRPACFGISVRRLPATPRLPCGGRPGTPAGSA